MKAPPQPTTPLTHCQFRLKYLSWNAAGYDPVDIDACTARGIFVSHTPSAVDNVRVIAIANVCMRFTIMQHLGHCRRCCHLDLVVIP